MKYLAPSKSATIKAADNGDGNVLLEEKAHSVMIDEAGVHVKVYWKNWKGPSATFFVDLEDGSVVKDSAGNLPALSHHACALSPVARSL